MTGKEYRKSKETGRELIPTRQLKHFWKLGSRWMWQRQYHVPSNLHFVFFSLGILDLQVWLSRKSHMTRNVHVFTLQKGCIVHPGETHTCIIIYSLLFSIAIWGPCVKPHKMEGDWAPETFLGGELPNSHWIAMWKNFLTFSLSTHSIRECICFYFGIV